MCVHWLYVYVNWTVMCPLQNENMRKKCSPILSWKTSPAILKQRIVVDHFEIDGVAHADKRKVRISFSILLSILFTETYLFNKLI